MFCILSTNMKSLYFICIFLLKSFAGLKKVCTFASAKRGKPLVRRLGIEFFDRFS